MKKVIILLFLVVSLVFAHLESGALNQEIQKGKDLIESLQKSEISCQNLTEDDFHAIGEYVMELMMGSKDHLFMNQMMQSMPGNEGEKLMHINMGKRFAGCENENSLSSMKGMMNLGFWRAQSDGFSNILGWFLIISWLLLMIIFPTSILALVILTVVYLIKKIKS